MNTINRLVYPLVALMSLGAAFAAHAESPTVDNSATQAWTQTKSRGQVQAELVQARADGSIKAHSTSYNPFLTSKSLMTREEVRAQTRVDKQINAGAQMLGEDSGSFYLAQQRSPGQAGTVMAGRR